MSGYSPREAKEGWRLRRRYIHRQAFLESCVVQNGLDLANSFYFSTIVLHCIPSSFLDEVSARQPILYDTPKQRILCDSISGWHHHESGQQMTFRRICNVSHKETAVAYTSDADSSCLSRTVCQTFQRIFYRTDYKYVPQTYFVFRYK
jgi:hypothetical protein